MSFTYVNSLGEGKGAHEVVSGRVAIDTDARFAGKFRLSVEVLRVKPAVLPLVHHRNQFEFTVVGEAIFDDERAHGPLGDRLSRFKAF